MPTRQPPRTPIPRIWLMTDPRLDGQLLGAIRRLPNGSGVIFRHHGLGESDRRKLFRSIRRICRQRGHMLLLAADAGLARKWNADGVHRRGKAAGTGLHSASVHNASEIHTAKRHGADILLLSPLRATNSHPGKRALRPLRFGQLAKLCRPAKVIALGGMSRAEAAKWSRRTVHGWAAIDAFKL